MNTKLDDIFKSNKSSSKSKINNDDLFSDLEVSTLLAKSSVPYSHRRIADNYVVLRRICSFQIVQPRITMVETALLNKYSFDTLENTTISKANKEIAQLKDWATSTDDIIREDATKLLNIRVKEIKFVLSDNYSTNSNEMFKGYKAYETYLTNVTRYYR